MSDPFHVPEPERRTPRLEDLRADLAAAQFSNALKPGQDSIKPVSLSPDTKQGYFGEDQLVRTASGRGEIILDYASGIEDTNKGGADLVTLAERDGELTVVMYDNKSLSKESISSVTALRENFDKNLEDMRAHWEDIVKDSNRSPAEIALFQAALDCAGAEPPRVDRVVTNANSAVSRISGSLEVEGIKFENLAGNPIAAGDKSITAEAERHMFKDPSRRSP